MVEEKQEGAYPPPPPLLGKIGLKLENLRVITVKLGNHDLVHSNFTLDVESFTLNFSCNFEIST